MATAPQAIWNLWYRVASQWSAERNPGKPILAGIVGDVHHSFGFHLAPDELPSSDYSLQTARDKAGAREHPGDASALDIHFDPGGMVMATKRLIAAAEARDPRMNCLYEFCGTTNGTSPHPYTVDTHTDDPNNTQGWDVSHTSHVHLSIHRDVCEDFEALKGVADVIAGITTETDPLEEIMSWYKDQAAFEAAVAKIAKKAAADAVNALAKGPDGKPHMIHTYMQGVPGYAEPPVMAPKKGGKK